MLLRSLQIISQLYIKYIENALFICNNDDNDIITIIIIAVADSNDDLRIKKKLSFK